MGTVLQVISLLFGVALVTIGIGIFFLPDGVPIKAVRGGNHTVLGLQVLTGSTFIQAVAAMVFVWGGISVIRNAIWRKRKDKPRE